jgi:hypothetical protein
MKNVKNFKIYTPSKEKIHNLGLSDLNSISFLISDDGQDWYECQKLFSADKVKVMYDSNMIIVSVVGQSIPDNDYGCDISMLFPNNASVAEVEDLPAGFTINGEWQYRDGIIVPRKYSNAELSENAERKKDVLISECSIDIMPLQDAVDLNIATEAEIAKLANWKKYRVELSRIDTNLAPDIDWPTPPE